VIQTLSIPVNSRYLNADDGVDTVAFGGTGLCAYRVRGVDGNCAKHLTVETYTVIYAANSHTYYYY